MPASTTFSNIEIPSNTPDGTILASSSFGISIKYHASGYRTRNGFIKYPDYAQIIPLTKYPGLAVRVSVNGGSDAEFIGWDDITVSTYRLPDPVTVELIKQGDVSILLPGFISDSVDVRVGWKVPGCNGSASAHDIGRLLEIPLNGSTNAELCKVNLNEATTSQKINITGSIVRIVGNCELYVPDTVTLPPMVTSALTSSGEGQGGETPFNINFRNCQGDIQSVKVSLDAPTAATDNQTIATGAGSVSTNVGIQILYNDTPIKFTNLPADRIELASSGSGDVRDFDSNMIVRYKAFGSPQPGAISIPVNFTVPYD